MSGTRSWGNGRPQNMALRKQAQRQLAMHCTQCGSTERLELDHIIPLVEDGADTIGNCQWLCHRCHYRKTQDESRRAMRRRAALRFRPRQQHPSDALGGGTPSGSRSNSPPSLEPRYPYESS